MKLRYSLIALAILPMYAQATVCHNGAKNYPQCTVEVTPPAANTNVHSNSRAAARAAARANAAATSNATASNENSNAAETGPVDVNASDSSSSSYRVNAFAFPPPVQLPPSPQPADCIGTFASGHAIGWSFASATESEQKSVKECVLGQRVQVLRLACQFDAANKVEARLIQMLTGDSDQVEMARDRNLSHEECHVYHNPPPILIPPPAPVPPAVPSTPLIEPCPKGQKRNSKGVCYKPVPPQPICEGELMCKPKDKVGT